MRRVRQQLLPCMHAVVHVWTWHLAVNKQELAGDRQQTAKHEGPVGLQYAVPVAIGGVWNG